MLDLSRDATPMLDACYTSYAAASKAVASLCKRHKMREQQEQMLVRGKQRNLMETEKVEPRVK